MTAKPPPPQGFMGLPDFGDLLGELTGGIAEQVTGLIPGPIGDAIQDTVGRILDPDDDSLNIGDPQPPGERPIPTTDPKELNAAVKAIDAVLGGINLILRFGFLVPDQYEEPLRKLAGALSTVRGWLD